VRSREVLRVFALLLYSQGYLINLRIRFVVSTGVIEHQDNVSQKLFDIFVVRSFNFLSNFFQVNRLLNYFIIVRVLLDKIAK
jgi:hypothetical protein